MMNDDISTQMPRLLKLREQLFAAITVELNDGSGAKSYEGRFEIVMPDYFTDTWGINLHCYVLGPSRHYSWVGKTFGEAISNAEHDILGFIDPATANAIAPDSDKS